MSKPRPPLLTLTLCLLIAPMLTAEPLTNQMDPSPCTLARTRRLLQMAHSHPSPSISRKGPTLMFPLGTSLATMFSAESLDQVGTVDWAKKVVTDGTVVYISPVEINRSLNHERIVSMMGGVAAETQPRLYYFKDPSEDSTRTLSLVLSIIYMALAGCCMCCGLKQFYHLIKIPQMLFILSLIGSQPKASLLVNYLDGFKKNLFNIIPNPVKFVDDNAAFGCLLPLDFYVDGYTCNSYNTLKNYVLVFLVFLAIYILMQCNKYDNIHFWDRFKNTLSIAWFFLACAPDILIASFLNLSAGSNNTPHGLGVLFAFFLIYVQFYILIKYARIYWTEDPQIYAFLSFFNFEPKEVIEFQPHSSIRLLYTAFVLENLKVWIKAILIVFFNNHPKTSMVIIFVVYFLNALFTLLSRPYTHLLQTCLHTLSDLFFCALVVLMYVAESSFATSSMNFKEVQLATAQAILFWAIFILNILLLTVPALKNSREREIDLHRVKILHQQDLEMKQHSEHSHIPSQEDHKAKQEEKVQTTSKPNPADRDRDPLFSEENRKGKEGPENEKFKTATDKFDMGPKAHKMVPKGDVGPIRPESLTQIDPTPVIVSEKDRGVKVPSQARLDDKKPRDDSPDRMQLESLGNNVQHHIPDTIEVKKNNLTGKNEETSAMINQNRLPELAGQGRKIPLKKKTKHDVKVNDSDFENL
jgi:hypothetical protein